MLQRTIALVGVSYFVFVLLYFVFVLLYFVVVLLYFGKWLALHLWRWDSFFGGDGDYCDDEEGGWRITTIMIISGDWIPHC